MRKWFLVLAVVWVGVLSGCGSSFSWQIAGTWHSRQLDPARDSGYLEQNGIRQEQAHRYQLLVYRFTMTNTGRTKAEWVGVLPIMHPDFQERIKSRFGLEDHPPLNLRPGEGGATGAVYIVEGTAEEVGALAEKNRFYLRWQHQGKEMRQDVQPTKAQQ